VDNCGEGTVGARVDGHAPGAGLRHRLEANRAIDAAEHPEVAVALRPVDRRVRRVLAHGDLEQVGPARTNQRRDLAAELV